MHIKPSAPIRWIFSTVMGFKMQLFDSSVHSNTVLDLVWLSDRQVIFSTPPKRLSVLFWAKRTSDLSSAPHNCLGSIYSSLSDHTSSQESSKQPRCTRCHVRNIFFRTRLLPYALYGDFHKGKFDVSYLQNYYTKFFQTKFISMDRIAFSWII